MSSTLEDLQSSQAMRFRCRYARPLAESSATCFPLHPPVATLKVRTCKPTHWTIAYDHHRVDPSPRQRGRPADTAQTFPLSLLDQHSTGRHGSGPAVRRRDSEVKRRVYSGVLGDPGGALVAPGELPAVHEVLRVGSHELGDEHGAARVHARAQELHHVHVAALLQDRDLRAAAHPASERWIAPAMT